MYNKFNKRENIVNKKETNSVQNMSTFKLGWPIFVQALLSMCLGYIDTLMISNHSPNAVGGIGNANQILGFLTLAFSIISTASGVVVAQYIGAKVKEKLNEIYTVAVIFNLALSVGVSAILFLLHNFIIKLMHVPEEMVPSTRDYMLIVGGLLFLQATLDTFSQFFRSNGKTKIGMMISLSMNLINIVGNYCFLYGPLKFLGLSTKGVAISTVFARAVAVIMAIIYFIKYIDGNISIKYLKPFPKDILKKLILVGLPAAGENISYNIAQLVILGFINSLSALAVNTRIYANILSSFAYLFSVSAAMATSIIVGHEVGAKEYDKAYKRVLSIWWKAVIIAETIAIIGFFISPFTFGIFTDNADIIKLGSQVMFICIFLELGRSTNLVVIQSLRAAGDVRFPTYLGMASMWGVSVLFSYILGIAFHGGIIGIWIAMAMDELLRGIIVIIRWIKGTWRDKRVVDDL